MSIVSVSSLLAFFSPGPMEMLIIGIVAVLLFGKRLPEVGRSLGKGLVEFKKGIRGVEDEMNSVTREADRAARYNNDDDRDVATAPKFEPPPTEPRDESVTA